MCLGGGYNDGGAADRRRQAELERQAKIDEGRAIIDDTFSQFDDEFYDQQTKNYLDFATPQLTDQFNEAAKKLTLQLADAGLLNSSIAAEKRGALDKRKGTFERQIADKAKQFSNKSLQNIEAAKSDLMNQNMNLANPSLIASQAATRAELLNQLPVYEPLIDLFASATEGLATQADLERRGKARYPNLLFNTSNQSRIIS